MTSSMYRAVMITALVSLPVFYVVVMFLNGVSNSPQLGIFKKTMSEASDIFRSDITPASWAFSIWSIIYAWQAALIIYLLVGICRRSPSSPEKHFFQSPGAFPLISVIMYGSSYLLTICWLFFFDRATIHSCLLAFAMVSLWLVVFVLGVALFFSYKRSESDEVILNASKIDVWANRILAHNGISIYVGWCSVAAPLNTSMVCSYLGGTTPETGGTIALALVATEMLLYAGMDIFLLDRWTRYTITPHCVLVWAFSASLVKNYHPGRVNSTFTLVLLVVAVVALISKIIIMLIRHFKYPAQVSVSLSRTKLDCDSLSSSTDIKKPIA